MALPNNILQTVQTYQESSLAYLSNQNCFTATANKKFKDFQNREANLGDTVTFDLPPRYTSNDSLVAIFQDSAQRVQSLTCGLARNTSFAFNAQQFVFNVHDYMDKFGKSAIKELGAYIESDVASIIPTNTYRFYGDGVTAINSFGQLATALAMFRNYGAAIGDTRGYLLDVAVPGIVNTGLQQFVMNRNNEIANSWELGRFSNCEWYQSNLLPQHDAGTVGNGASAAVQTLTVVSTNDPTGANITQITCTCDASLSGSADAIKLGDVGYFLDGVAGVSNVRYLTFIGHKPSANPVQIAMTADAGATLTTVVLSITPGLSSVAGRNQNITTNIVAGMKIKIMPSHKCGLITSGDALFMAMPKLPEEVPFPTASTTDADTGLSLRQYYGCLFGQNQRGMVYDAIWGKTLVPEYSMRILFPL